MKIYLYQIFYSVVNLFTIINSLNLDNFKTFYIQMGVNSLGQTVQKNSDCVISRFSRFHPNSSMFYIFQGINPNTNKIESYQGQINPFNYNSSISNEMPCGEMYDIDANGLYIPVHSKHFLCIWEYEPKNMDWIIFTNPNKTFFSAMIHNSTINKNDIHHFIKKYETEHNNTVHLIKYDLRICEQFI
jgi:hypothetical protein